MERTRRARRPRGTQRGEGAADSARSVHSAPDGSAEEYPRELGDATEEIRIQEQLSSSNRLMALGELAAGVAHNFGNLLMSVSATLELLYLRTATEPALADLADTLREAQEQVIRGAEVVHRLLALARCTAHTITGVDPKRIADNALALCATHPRAGRVYLANDVPNGAPLIKADAGQLEEVLVNLLLNSLQASEGGSIRIGVRDYENGFVGIRVADEGCGIAPEDIEQVFRPFFSRRRDGIPGTGIGLSCSLAQIRRMGGTIEVQSESGAGSTFEIRLPKWVEQIEAREAA